MKRRSILVLSTLVLLLVAAVATPASAAQRLPVGPYINLFLGDSSYPASTAFHMRGGFLIERGATAAAMGKYNLTLEMDGQNVPATLRANTTPDNLIVRTWYFEFPDGLTGTHSFVSHYWMPCGSDPFIGCGSNPPNTAIDVAAIPATITFVP